MTLRMRRMAEGGRPEDDRAARGLGVPFAAALLYSTLVYFGWEVWAHFSGENPGVNMWMVVTVNIPYSIQPVVSLFLLSGRRPRDKEN
jgi:hypothetical protein